MEYKLIEKGEWAEVLIEGKYEPEGPDCMRDFFDGILAKGYKKVSIDLGNVDVLSSACIGNLLLLYRTIKKQGGEFVIKRISSNLKQMFKLLHIDKIIELPE